MAESSTNAPLITPLCSIFRQFLKRQGLKFTAERAQVLDSVLSKTGVFEAEQLMAEIRAAGYHVSKATVYRTLKHLLDAGIINEVLLDSRHAHYELTFGRQLKGHLVCTRTGKVIEFPITVCEDFIKQACAEHGFEYDYHRVVIYGLSPEGREMAEKDD